VKFFLAKLWKRLGLSKGVQLFLMKKKKFCCLNIRIGSTLGAYPAVI